MQPVNVTNHSTGQNSPVFTFSRVARVALPVICGVGTVLLAALLFAPVSIPAIISFAIVGAAMGYGLYLLIEKVSTFCLPKRAELPPIQQLNNKLTKLHEDLRSLRDEEHFIKLRDFCEQLKENECTLIAQHIASLQENKIQWFSTAVTSKQDFENRSEPIETFATTLITVMFEGYNELWNNGKVVPSESTLGSNYRNMKEEIPDLLRALGEKNFDALFAHYHALPRVINVAGSRYSQTNIPPLADELLNKGFGDLPPHHE